MTWRTALRRAVRPGALAQSTTAAFTVGSILCVVNLFTAPHDTSTGALALRTTLTFLVPWFNATMGIAIGLRKSAVIPCHPLPATLER